ncbi:transposase domain-containing protein [Streptomyces pyxinae]|uniref:transposase domain-containing protein n=1 Tax=Streptomyces pyxinae TaxID=2970734 RepID=UPI002867FB7E|nr:transposase domain-containing protein [Streptomyces sp. LP05-1]
MTTRAGATVQEESGRLADRLITGTLTWAYPPALVDEMVAAAGRTEQRVRALPARTMVYHALAMWLYPAYGHEEVMRRLLRGLARKHAWARDRRTPTPSALAQARRRLGPVPLRLLFQEVARRSVPEPTPGRRRTVALDTLALSVPDTPANRRHFGTAPVPGRGRTPRALVATLAHCGTRQVIDAAVGTLPLGAPALALDLLPSLTSLGSGTLLLGRLDTLSVDLWRQASATPAELLWRAGPEWSLPVDSALPDGSYLSRLSEPHGPSGAAPLRVRVVPVAPNRPGGADRLVTTLLGPEEAAAEQLRLAHHDRWGPADLLEDIVPGGLPGADMLRSRGPDLVEQEIWAMFLVHHAVRDMLADTQELERPPGQGTVAPPRRPGPKWSGPLVGPPRSC